MSQESQIDRSVKRVNPYLPPDSSAPVPWTPSPMTDPLRDPIPPAPWPQNQNPHPSPSQTSSQPPSRMQTATPSNLASSQPKSRLSTTSQPTDNGQLFLVPFSVQPQSSQTTSGRAYLTPEQQLDVIHWCITHKEWYADRNLCFKGEFWTRWARFSKEKFNKTYAAPGRRVRGLENRRRQEIAAGGAGAARGNSNKRWISGFSS